ncbi:MAG: RNA polymerase sigma factor [Phycisphaerales bacterium]|nr:MAG: RNA polymerase sigma factor [Phycisphaerales bacterium]
MAQSRIQLVAGRETVGANFYVENYPRIKLYVASRVKCAAEAEDLVQDVFVRFFESKGRRDSEAYLFGIARNTVRMHLRRRAHSVRTIRIKSPNAPALAKTTGRDGDTPWPTSAEECRKLVEYLASRLPAKTRQAIRLRFIEGLSSKAAARKAGCSVHTFQQRIYDATKAIRRWTSVFLQNSASEQGKNILEYK